MTSLKMSVEILPFKEKDLLPERAIQISKEMFILSLLMIMNIGILR